MGWQGRDPSTDFRLFSPLVIPVAVPLIFYLVHHFMVSLIQLFLDILNAQRSWIHFFGESVVLCKDFLSKLLTWLFSKQEIQTYDLPAKTLSNSF
jgi:hypothetical protein